MQFHSSKFLHYRNDFPMLKKKVHDKPLIYFDSAATTQKPQCVIDSIRNFYEDHYGTVHRAVYELASFATTEHHKAREKVQKFLNAACEEEIIFTRGTTDSINLVAYSFGKAFIQPGDEVVITELEHHSNIVPWQILCEDRNAVLKVIPINHHGEMNLEIFASMLNSKTKIVAVAHISNALGTINPIRQICAMAHQYGAKVLVDGAQAAPHLPIDVRELDADFYAFSGHKIFGPTGVGILYGKRELLNEMPPYQGGGDMIETVTFPKTTYNKLPLKFEAGTPMIAEVIALGTAIDYIQGIGLGEILQYEQQLLITATELLTKIPGLRIIGNAQEKGALISFVVEGVHPLDIGTMLDLHGIAVRTGHLCAQPVMRHFAVPSVVRLSFAFYNTLEEIKEFASLLERILRNLKKSG